MDWIKRNLFFVIGAVVALLLIVGAAFYTWSGYSHNAAAREDLNAKYAELKRLYESPLSPGDGVKVDNIKVAKDQLAEVRKVAAQSARRFQRTPPIVVNGEPLDGTNVSISQLSRGMSETIARLQRDATNSGIVLPPKYNFSFEQEADKVRLAASSLSPLAMQLSEVKALSEVLIQAKVNSIEAIQRERVAQEDFAGTQGDYIEGRSRTNELAVFAPYQLVFRSFTPELASVLCAFSGSPYGIVVKRINVEPAAGTTTDPGQMPTPMYVPPTVSQPAPLPPRFAEEGRYGGKGPSGVPNYPPAAPLTTAVAPSAPTGPKTVLNEKKLRITLQVEIVKMLPNK